MKLKLAATFVIFFVVSFFAFLPYGKIYSYVIGKVVEKNHAGVLFNIEKASAFEIYFKNIVLNFNGQNFNVKNVRLQFNPLFFVSSNLANVDIEKNRATFKVVRKSKSYIIEGYFYTSALRNVLPSPFKSFFTNMNGKNSLIAKVSFSNGSLIIDQMDISGDFNLKAKGYISKTGFHLNGTIKIGKISERFSI